MREEVLAIAGICACMAVCEQFMDQSRYMRAIRTALGFHIAGVMVKIVLDIIGLAKI
ncbi:MAG: hypothetical protein IJA26_08675 [Clostridia bacterium]|nr:hypothetical protein [Clostridia bacterium]